MNNPLVKSLKSKKAVSSVSISSYASRGNRDLSQVLILIFIAKLIKVEFGVKNEEKTWNVLRAS